MAGQKPSQPKPKPSQPKPKPSQPKRGPARGSKPKKPPGKKPGSKPGSPKKGAGSGGRVTVRVAEGKYSYMKKETADFFGFKAVPNATGPAGKPVRGSFRGGAIKVVSAGGTKSVPIPAGVGFDAIKSFLKTAKSNKPTDFISKDGLKWPLAQSSGKK